MKYLFERLKPEVKAVLDKELQMYPCAVGQIIDELKSNTYLGHIKYDAIMWLAGIKELRPIMGLDEYDYVGSYLIQNLHKLFNN